MGDKYDYLEIVEKIPLILVTEATFVPSTFGSTISTEWRVSTQEDVHHHSQTPEVTSLVVHQFLVSVLDECLDNLK